MDGAPLCKRLAGALLHELTAAAEERVALNVRRTLGLI